MNMQHSVKISAMFGHIDDLDLEPIAFKLVHPEPGETGMTEGRAHESIALYRQFLKMIAMFPKKSIVPTKQIDKAWHAHILDTSKYAKDCDAIFGYFLHHFPYLGLRGEADVQAWQQAFSETRELFAEHFGVHLPMSARECGGGCEGGGSSCDYGEDISMDLRERPRLVQAA